MSHEDVMNGLIPYLSLFLGSTLIFLYLYLKDYLNEQNRLKYIVVGETPNWIHPERMSKINNGHYEKGKGLR